MILFNKSAITYILDLLPCSNQILLCANDLKIIKYK